MFFQEFLLAAVEVRRFPAFRDRVEVVQAGLSDGGEGNGFRGRGQLFRPVFRRAVCIVRMNAQRAENRAGELARPGQVFFPVVHARSQSDHAVYSCLSGMPYVNFPAGLVELPGSQMAVRVNDHGVEPLWGKAEVCGYFPLLKSPNRKHA